ncbi:MAG: NPCBM/NEW2 domain-containing protein, partial [Lentisphaeria bacterium]|nr:NPCBM/NEW2 domain-containing protein [Lentisphaeria bacterium]
MIRHSILLLIVGCLLVHAQDPGAADCYARRGTWPETMTATRARFLELAAPPAANAFTSGIVRGRDDSRQIEVDIRGFGRLWLVAEDGGDGIGCDHSAWGEPELLDAQGSAVPLTDFQPVAANVGWNQLVVNRDVDGKPIRVREREFKTGFFAHARSRIQFDLAAIKAKTGRDFTTLRVWIGIASTGRDGGSCQFRVLPGLDRESLVDPLMDLVRRDFPEASGAFAAALGKRHRDWFLASDPAELEQAAVLSVLDSLKPHDANLRREFAALADTQRLAFFQRCVALRATVGEAEKTFDLARRTLDFIETFGPQPDLRAQFAGLDGDYAKLREQAEFPAERLAELVDRCRALRRATIFSHPALGFDTLLVSQAPPPGYSHMCDQYLGRHRRPGPGLVLLHDWKNTPKPQVLLAGKLPEGAAVKPDL